MSQILLAISLLLTITRGRVFVFDFTEQITPEHPCEQKVTEFHDEILLSTHGYSPRVKRRYSINLLPVKKQQQVIGHAGISGMHRHPVSKWIACVGLVTRLKTLLVEEINSMQESELLDRLNDGKFSVKIKCDNHFVYFYIKVKRWRKTFYAEYCFDRLELPSDLPSKFLAARQTQDRIDDIDNP
eukprot:199900_1